MAVDERLRRCAGVIMWHLTHVDPKTGQPNTTASAVAKASAREPELSESKLHYCLEWARAGLLFAEVSQAARPDTTLGQLIDAAGLRPFIEGNR